MSGQDASRGVEFRGEHRMQRRAGLIAIGGLSLSLAPTWSHAADVSDADARSVRTVIEGQLAAFAADDADKAFSFAAPGIRAMFVTADRFMSMVRQGYPVVYRPASVAFLKPEWVDDKLLQRVQMTDGAGAPWMVVYELERQTDRSWRIAACVAARGAARVT